MFVQKRKRLNFPVDGIYRLIIIMNYSSYTYIYAFCLDKNMIVFIKI